MIPNAMANRVRMRHEGRYVDAVSLSRSNLHEFQAFICYLLNNVALNTSANEYNTGSYAEAWRRSQYFLFPPGPCLFACP